ncbi:MAG: histidine--tRNA ligase [Roseivirga sp.]
MNKKIDISPISGFPEFLPEEQIVFDWAKQIIKESYEKVGATPIETAAVERLDVLLSKGGNNKEIYGIHRAADGDKAKKELGLHFDLTVPLARYVSYHSSSLVFPFKRYQIQPVWRGERAQAGRYRQFYQCDIDVIGNESLSLFYDAEMPYVIWDIFKKMNIGDFKIHINNRKILRSLFTKLELKEYHVGRVLKIIDDYCGINSEKNLSETESALLKEGITQNSTNKIIDFFDSTSSMTNKDTLKFLADEKSLSSNTEGLYELDSVYQHLLAMGMDEKNIQLDLRIARGLDYYTGTIYETKLESNPGLGSICSGGRYDNLTQYFSNRKLPGVGISIGLTRLIPNLIREGILQANTKTTAEVLIANLSYNHSIDYIKLGTQLRNSGINTEVYLEDRKVGKQLEYANKKGFKVVLFKGEDEFNRNTVTLKDMRSGEQYECSDELILEKIKAII